MSREEQFKAFELAWRQTLPGKSYTIIRVDGRAFHTLTRDMEKPFDHHFMNAMDAAAKALCEEIANAQFAFVQSDEISVLVTDFMPKRQQWFNGELPKMLSISAATATAAFMLALDDWDDPRSLFDSRVFTVPTRNDAISYFLWRQADCHRNAIQMIAQAHFEHRELQGRKTQQQIEMLHGAGVDIARYGNGPLRGRICTKHSREEEITFTHKKTGEVKTARATRNYWEVHAAPWLDWDERGFLELNVPLRGDESEDEDGPETP